ncbi:FAD-dependent oxidoreductase [Streptomyces tauricus]|uniref:FAD-dependent oxidoreductase n=1 Tax=Streptomyces tauricus TaxID=68274 RepID=UPI00341D183B
MVTRIAVAGGGIAGLSAALLLARQGYEIVLVERDGPPPERLDGVQNWHRPGAPQIRHPHMFLGLFHHLLRTRLPDVQADLLTHGIDLAGTGCRRATIEWALHRAVWAQDAVRIHHGVSAREVVVDAGRVRSLRIDGGVIEVDAVVDATGRYSPLADACAGEVEESPSGIVSYSRLYRLRNGIPQPAPFPDPIIFAGGMGFGGGLYTHDNRTFTVLFARLPEDDLLGRLREDGAFEAATRAVPQFEPWLRDGSAEPVGSVVSMAGFSNTWRELPPSAPVGYLPIGDVLCTTYPIMGRGTSLALAGAARLSELMADGNVALEAVGAGMRAHARDDVRPWYDDAVHEDAERTRSWRATVGAWADGPESRDAHRAEGELSLAVLVALAGRHDPRLGELAQRRINLLVHPDSLDTPEVHERLRAVLADERRAPLLSPEPTYQELTRALAAHRIG